MISNRNIKSKKKQTIYCPSFQPQIQAFNTLIQNCLQHQRTNAIEQLFRFYNVFSLLQIWVGLDQSQKLDALSQITMVTCFENQKIVDFMPRMRIKEVSFLVKGSVHYRIQILGRQYQLQYLARDGQMLAQPLPFEDFDFKPFSLYCTKPCLLLKIPYTSKIRQLLWKQKEASTKNLFSSVQRFITANKDAKSPKAIMPYFSAVTFHRGQPIFPDKTKANYICYLEAGQIEFAKISKAGKELGILEKTQEQVFIIEENQTYSMKCKSNLCRLFVVPQFFYQKMDFIKVTISIKEQNNACKSFRQTMFSKTEKFFKNPKKVFRLNERSLKKKKKRSSESLSVKRKSKSCWDLIEHISKNETKKQKNNIGNQQESIPSERPKRTTFSIISEMARRGKNKSQTDLRPSSPCEYQRTNMLVSHLKGSSWKSVCPIRAQPLQEQLRRRNRNFMQVRKFELLKYAKNGASSSIADCFP